MPRACPPTSSSAMRCWRAWRPRARPTRRSCSPWRAWGPRSSPATARPSSVYYARRTAAEPAAARPEPRSCARPDRSARRVLRGSSPSTVMGAWANAAPARGCAAGGRGTALGVTRASNLRQEDTMANWDDAVVVDARELQRLRDEHAKLVKAGHKQRLALLVLAGCGVVTASGLYLGALRLTATERDAQQCRDTAISSS